MRIASPGHWFEFRIEGTSYCSAALRTVSRTGWVEQVSDSIHPTIFRLCQTIMKEVRRATFVSHGMGFLSPHFSFIIPCSRSLLPRPITGIHYSTFQVAGIYLNFKKFFSKNSFWVLTQEEYCAIIHYVVCVDGG